MKKHVLISVIFVLIITPLTVPTTSYADPSGFCGNENIIIVDGKQHCAQNNSLAQLITNYETFTRKNNPYVAGRHGDDKALRKLPDVSPENTRTYMEKIETFQQQLDMINPDNLDDKNLLNYKLLEFVFSQTRRSIPFDINRIPFSNDNGFFNELSYISRQTRFQTIDDYEAYTARLSAIPQYFGQHKANMRRGMDTNFTASAEIMPGIIETVKTLSEYIPEEHPYFQPFLNLPDHLSPDEKNRLTALGEAAIRNALIPAYKDLFIFFTDEYLPKARSSAGIGSMAEGRAYYASMVRYYTNLDITPDEVHEIGLREVARIRKEMNTIINSIGFQGSFAEFLQYLRTDPQFYAQTEEDLLKEAAWLAKQIDGKMPEFFGTLARLPYGVIAVPEELAPNYTTGRYWPGNLELGKSGNYVVNTHDLTQRPLYNLPALTLHEGVPGHHHQISLGQELKNVPEFRKNLYPTAFGEGWGMYAEKLGIEMGIYKTPYENFGRLTYEMWRACRLVVDTGMHWKGWTREQAENCFFENAALAPHNIKTEVLRYISWPGQALAYKIGELKILELRQLAETQLGDQFSIREFHDQVLLDGGLPLNVLEKKIKNWIATKLSTPQ